MPSFGLNPLAINVLFYSGSMALLLARLGRICEGRVSSRVSSREEARVYSFCTLSFGIVWKVEHGRCYSPGRYNAERLRLRIWDMC
jgi:hypothetical protein